MKCRSCTTKFPKNKRKTQKHIICPIELSWSFPMHIHNDVTNLPPTFERKHFVLHLQMHKVAFQKYLRLQISNAYFRLRTVSFMFMFQNWNQDIIEEIVTKEHQLYSKCFRYTLTTGSHFQWIWRNNITKGIFLSHRTKYYRKNKVQLQR